MEIRQKVKEKEKKNRKTQTNRVKWEKGKNTFKCQKHRHKAGTRINNVQPQMTKRS